MRDTRTGAAFRAVRIRRGWRQADVAARARVSRWVVSQIERGEIGRTSLDTVERVAAALEMRLHVIARWRGGDLDRLLNARHSAFHELVARYLSSTDGWVFVFDRRRARRYRHPCLASSQSFAPGDRAEDGDPRHPGG